MILISPSRYGKTEYARALGSHIYWNGMVNLDDWNDDAGYAIFDDFDWNFIPSKKGFLGAQKSFTLTDKYRKKKTVTWGNPCIVLCNEMPDILPVSLYDWVRVNCEIVILDNKLY